MPPHGSPGVLPAPGEPEGRAGGAKWGAGAPRHAVPDLTIPGLCPDCTLAVPCLYPGCSRGAFPVPGAFPGCTRGAFPVPGAFPGCARGAFPVPGSPKCAPWRALGRPSAHHGALWCAEVRTMARSGAAEVRTMARSGAPKGAPWRALTWKPIKPIKPIKITNNQ